MALSAKDHGEHRQAAGAAAQEMTYCRRGCRMRKRVGFLLSLLAGLLSACATPRWVKPEASKTDLAQDQAACVHEVQQPPPAGTTDQQHYEACMNAHGWKLQQ